MKSFVTSVFFLLAGATIAMAQPTITYEQFLQAFTASGGMQIGDSYSSTDLNGLSTLIETAGANKSWDISTHTYTKRSDTATYSLVAVSSAPLSADAEFAGATHVLKTIPTDTKEAISYAYIKIDQSGYFMLGIVADESGTYTKLAYSPAMQVLKFPLTYNTTWSSTSSVSSPDIPQGATYTIQTDALVDGYGTLVLPGGSATCLRTKKATTTTISFGTFNQVTKSDSYEWTSPTGQSATILADQNHQPTSLSYSIRAGGSDDVKAHLSSAPQLQITANPAGSATSATFELPSDASVTLTLNDITGNEVSNIFSGKAHAGYNSIDINTSSLSNGIYVLRMQTSIASSVTKLVVAH